MELVTITWDMYKQFRKFIYSKDSLEFDDPERPLPNEEEENTWWNNYVEKQEHKVWGIKKDQNIIGLVHAFCFEDDKCEVGINIFERNNYGKGYGREGVRLLENELKKIKIKLINAEINTKNIRAKTIFIKLGYKKINIRKEETIEWDIFQKELIN